MFTFSPEDIDAVCDLWPKYGVQPIRFYQERAPDGRLTGGCLVTVQALQLGYAPDTNFSPLGNQLGEIVTALGLSLGEFWSQVDGFDGDDTATSHDMAYYQFGKAVADRLTERGLWTELDERERLI